ncbi:MAG: OsmC family protein [Candidatus Lokiarchaeota archaeon]|nr:OsmC family protein [Candidatus Lokiarchaeota archaeon]
MINSEEISTSVGIKLEKEMIFKCDLGDINVKECYIDDTNKNEADMWGPNPARMIGMATIGCLSASFIFCMKKKNLNIKDLESEAKIIIRRNEKGLWRIKKIDVIIKPKLDTPEMKKRAEQCQKFFEDYCTVTQSIREGIPVKVNFDYK